MFLAQHFLSDLSVLLSVKVKFEFELHTFDVSEAQHFSTHENDLMFSVTVILLFSKQMLLRKCEVVILTVRQKLKANGVKKKKKDNVVKKENTVRASTNQHKIRKENDTRKRERNHTRVTNVLIVEGYISALQHASRSLLSWLVQSCRE